MQAVARTGLMKPTETGELRLENGVCWILRFARRAQAYPVGPVRDGLRSALRLLSGVVHDLRGTEGLTLRAGGSEGMGLSSGRSLAVRRASLKVWVIRRRILSPVA